MVGSIKNRIAAFEEMAVQSRSTSKLMEIVPPSPGFSATKSLGQSFRPKETSGFVPTISKPNGSTSKYSSIEKRRLMVKTSRDQQFEADLDVYQTYKKEKKAKDNVVEGQEEDREENDNEVIEEDSLLTDTDPLSPVKMIRVHDDSSRENVEDRDQLSISPLSFQGYQVESKRATVGSMQEIETIQEEGLSDNTEGSASAEEKDKKDITTQVNSNDQNNNSQNKNTITSDGVFGETQGTFSSATREGKEQINSQGSKSSDSENSSYFMMDRAGNIADVSVASEDDPFADDFEEIRQELKATAIGHKARFKADASTSITPSQDQKEDQESQKNFVTRAEDAQTNTIENREQYNLLSSGESSGEHSGSSKGILEDDDDDGSSFTEYLNDLRPVPAKLNETLYGGDDDDDTVSEDDHEDLNIHKIRSVGSGSSESNVLTYSSNSAEGGRDRVIYKRPVIDSKDERTRQLHTINDAGILRGGSNHKLNDNHNQSSNEKNRSEDVVSPVYYPEEDFREDDYEEEILRDVYYKQAEDIPSGAITSHQNGDQGGEDNYTKYDEAGHPEILGLNEEDYDGVDATTTEDDESDLLGVDIDDESMASDRQEIAGTNGESRKKNLRSTNDPTTTTLLQHDGNDYMKQPIRLTPIKEYSIPDYLDDNMPEKDERINSPSNQNMPSTEDAQMHAATTPTTSNNSFLLDPLQHEDSVSQITDASFDDETTRNKWPLADEQQQQTSQQISDASLMTYSTTEDSNGGIMQSKPNNAPIFRQRNSLHENKKIFGESNPVISNAPSNISEITDPMASVKKRPSYPKVHKRKTNSEEVVVLSTISGPMKKPNEIKTSKRRSPSPFSRKNHSNRTNSSNESYQVSGGRDDRRGRQREAKKDSSRFSIRSLSPFRRRSSKNAANEKPYKGPMSQIEASRNNMGPTPTTVLREDEARETSIPLVAVASSDDSEGDQRKSKKKFSFRSLSPFRKRRKNKRKSRKADPFDEGDDSM